MKAFTDIEQSKKLAEILLLESADMHYNNASTKGTDYVGTYRAELMDYNTAKEVMSIIVNAAFEIIPCWSLAALIGVLPRYLKYTEGRCPLNLLTLDFENPHRKDHCWIVGYWDYDEEYETFNFQIEAREDEIIDACVELIENLHNKMVYDFNN